MRGAEGVANTGKRLPRAVRVAGAMAMLVAVAHAGALIHYGHLVVTEEPYFREPGDPGPLFGDDNPLATGLGYATLAVGVGALLSTLTFAYLFARGYRVALAVAVFPALPLLWLGIGASAKLALRPWLWMVASAVAAAILLGGAIGYGLARVLGPSRSDDPLAGKLTAFGMAVGGALSAALLATAFPRHPHWFGRADRVFWTVAALAEIDRDPELPVEGHRCVVGENGSCGCSRNRHASGTCGLMQCCYKWDEYNFAAMHGHVSGSGCYCDPPDDDGRCHPVPKVPTTWRVRTCP